MPNMITTTKETRGTRHVASLPEPAGYCADCDKPIYRSCDLCGESEQDHPSYCDPSWSRHVPMLCPMCAEIAERDATDDGYDRWMDHRFGAGNW